MLEEGGIYIQNLPGLGLLAHTPPIAASLLADYRQVCQCGLISIHKSLLAIKHARKQSFTILQKHRLVGMQSQSTTQGTHELHKINHKSKLVCSHFAI